MEACNAHYYATRDPLGAAGDFTTAPEISQMFGEMVGAALADCWDARGQRRRRRLCRAWAGPRHARRRCAAGAAPRGLRGRGASRRNQPGAARGAGEAAARRRSSTTRIDDAARRRRCCSSPTNSSTRCRSGNGSAARSGGSPSTAAASPSPRWPDPRRLARARGGRAGSSRAASGEPRRRRADHRLWLCRRRAGRHAAGGARPPLRRRRSTDPGEQDLTAHVDFAALGRRGAARRRASRAASSARATWLETLGIGARATALAAQQPAAIPKQSPPRAGGCATRTRWGDCSR